MVLLRQLVLENPPGGHRERPPCSLHGLIRVGAQVQKHLVDLGGAAVDIDGPAVRLHHQTDAGREQHPHHFQGVPDDGVEIDHIVLGGVGLPPAEGKDLIHDLLGPAARLIDLVNVLIVFVFRAQLLLQKLGVPHDRGQQIVELMDDPPGQGPDGLQLLVVAHLLPALMELLQRAVHVPEVARLNLQLLPVFLKSVYDQNAGCDQDKNDRDQKREPVQVLIDHADHLGIGHHRGDIPGGPA